MKDLIRKIWVKFFEERRRRERLQKTAISMVLIAAVVSATVYVAVSPAHTMEAEASLSCEKEEHVHGESCFEEQSELICGLEESAEEHTHTEDCYGTKSVLICELEEHSHASECYSRNAETPKEETGAENPPEAQPSDSNEEAVENPEENVEGEEIPDGETEGEELPEEIEDTATTSDMPEATPSNVPETDIEYSVTLADGLVITMTGPADAFPEGTLTMRAVELHEGDADYEAALSLLSGETEDEVVLEQRIFDICLLDENGSEVQPVKEVRVTFSQVLNGEEKGVQIHHLDTEENVAEPIDTIVEGDNVSMETGHFSYYSMTLAGSGAATIGDKSYDTLAKAVAAVKSGETIVLQKDIEEDNIKISKDIKFTINVNGHTWTGKSKDLLTISKANTVLALTGGEGGGTLQAASGYRVITASVDCTINIENLKLQGNGQTTNAGILGSIPADRVKGATIFMKNCELTGGDVTKEGGAIYIKNGNLTAENCTIEGNRSVNSGAVFVWAFNYPGSVSFSGCHFSNNKVGNSARGGGGAITVASQGTRVLTLDIINKCKFTENESEKDGGAIYFNSDKGKLTITDTDFLRNHTVRNGGAVYIDKGVSEINGTKFQENRAGTETSKGSGGGLYVKYNSDIRDTVFENNQAERGGAISISLSKSNQTLKLERVTADRNNASNMGGAICDETGTSGTALEIQDCNIWNNVAGYTAGGVYSNSKKVFITGKTVIKENVAEGDSNKTSDSSKKIIGGVYLNNSMTPISYKLDETAHVYKNKTQNENIIKNGKCAEIYLYYKKGVNLVGFEGNTVTDTDVEYTLAMYSSGSDRYYYNDVVEPERIYLDPLGTHTHDGNNFVASTLEEAVAHAREKKAEKIYICSSVSLTAEDEANLNTDEAITFFRCSENRNYVFQINSGNEVTFEKTRINGDLVEADYALVLVTSGATLNIKGDTVIEAGNNINKGKDGGGGGVRVSGTLNMSGGAIQGNQAGRGGSGIYAPYATLTLTGGKVLDNKGEGDGGGIYLGDGKLSIVKGGEGRTLISGNSCVGQGGGIFIGGYAQAEITYADILNNNTKWENLGYAHGGGIYVDTRASLKMKNLYVTDNYQVKKSGANILGCTVYSCNTGSMALFELNGALIADNRDVYDIHFYGNKNVVAYISGHVLGGSDANWSGTKDVVDTSKKLELWGISNGFWVYSHVNAGAKETAKVMAESDGVVMMGNWAHGYGTAIANNGRLVVGTEEMSLTVNKVWKDVNGNVIADTSKYEEIPENLRVSLMKSLNGAAPELATEFTDAEVQLNRGNKWSHTWEKLGDSEAVVWSLEENKDDAAGFDVEISEKELDTSWKSVVQKHYIITITNTEKSEVDVAVKKDWIDGDNANEWRPQEIAVQLWRSDNSEKPFKTQTLNDGNQWFHKFEKLPKYDSAGTKYTYSVKEIPVENYTSEISEPKTGAQGITYTITNTVYGKAQIKKTLDSYNESLGGAMFVFDVKAVLEDKVIFNDVFTADFKAPGTQTIDIGEFPVGTQITVEEVYTGSSYELSVGDKQQNLTIRLNSEGTGTENVLAEYLNTYDDKLVPGAGVRNHYERNNGGWTGSQAVN